MYELWRFHTRRVVVLCELRPEHEFRRTCPGRSDSCCTGCYSPVDQRMSIRKSEMDEMQRMINYFSQKSAEYDEYDRVCELLDPNLYRKRGGLLAWGILFALLSILFFVIAAYSKESAFIITALVILIGAALMIMGYVLSSNARARNYAYVCRRFDELSDELYTYYKQYGSCMVSAEYTNPANLLAIYEVMNSGRADTIKEAINILISDAHRNNMEYMARQTAIASRAAARGAQTAAVFSAANFFLR